MESQPMRAEKEQIRRRKFAGFRGVFHANPAIRDYFGTMQEPGKLRCSAIFTGD